jgi:hypothetical protein
MVWTHSEAVEVRCERCSTAAELEFELRWVVLPFSSEGQANLPLWPLRNPDKLAENLEATSKSGQNPSKSVRT